MKALLPFICVLIIIQLMNPHELMSEREESTAKPTLVNSGDSVSLGIIAEALEALDSELLYTNKCNGGEPIQVAMRMNPSDTNTIEIVYRVPGVLQVYRLAYIQVDGLVLLADDIAFSDLETRYSMKPIEDKIFESKAREFALRVESHVSQELSEIGKERHLQREARKRKAVGQP